MHRPIGAALIAALTSACTDDELLRARRHAAALEGLSTAPEAASPVQGVAPEQSASKVTRARPFRPVFAPRALAASAELVVVELAGAPLARVRRAASARVAERRAALERQHEQVIERIEALGVSVERAYRHAYNGLLVRATPAQRSRLAQLDGVRRLHPRRAVALASFERRAERGHRVWKWPELELDGAGVKVAVIDTGIDYTHAAFGGPGTEAAYAEARERSASVADGAWFGPGAPRVKGGFDFVGDDYDPASPDPERRIPRPDPNPLDCAGHGTGVASVLGGTGVLEPQDGPGWVLPPGVAPGAELYALRVQSCEGGGSAFILDAVEWALEHDMDVISTSLTAGFAGNGDPHAAALQNAVAAGVVVVTAAGNAGDAGPYFAAALGAPTGVLSAGALDAVEGGAGAPPLWSFSTTGVALDHQLRPLVLAPGVGIPAAVAGTGTGALPQSGTSLSAPLVAGAAALVRQAHPEWSAETVALSVLATADPAGVSSYEVPQAGAGAVDARAAARTQVTVRDERSFAANFGLVEARREREAVRRALVVDNHSERWQHFRLSAPAAQAGGVSHAVQLPARVSVPPRGRRRVVLEVGLDALDGLDPEGFNAFYGSVRLTPERGSNAGVSLQLPYFGVVRPVTALDAELRAPSFEQPSGSIALHNRGARAATASLFSWGIEGERDPIGCNDVRAAGVQATTTATGERELTFLIHTFEPCATPAFNEYDLYISTQAGREFLAYVLDEGLLTTGRISGRLAVGLADLATDENWLLPGQTLLDSATLRISLPASLLGLDADSPRFSYATATSPLLVNAGPGVGDDPLSEPGFFNAFESALVGVGQSVTVAPQRRGALELSLDASEWAETSSLGLLLSVPSNPPGPEEALLLELVP